jgi:hypothetical protein
MYRGITPGSNLTQPDVRSDAEAMLLNEIGAAREEIRKLVHELALPTSIKVAFGAPKGAWAHIYYLSFHDPRNSGGPTEGFYPVFLLSADCKLCWLSVCLAAGSVGISGRGGWSKLRGEQLKVRARGLASSLPDYHDWKLGPIELGEDGRHLFTRSGSDRPSGRGYECGAIISKSFDPLNPPLDLAIWIQQAFAYFDSILSGEALYIQTVVPRTNVDEDRQQASAAITGAKAETLFETWAAFSHPEWGTIINLTTKVGYGYDFEFPESDLKIEVKGCRQQIEDIRLTENEWRVAEDHGDLYILCIVSFVDSPNGAQFTLIRNPFAALQKYAVQQARLQITYSVPRSALSARY